MYHCNNFQKNQKTVDLGFNKNKDGAPKVLAAVINSCYLLS